MIIRYINAATQRVIAFVIAVPELDFVLVVISYSKITIRATETRLEFRDKYRQMDAQTHHTFLKAIVLRTYTHTVDIQRVCVCVYRGTGRAKSAGADKWRGLIAAPTSVLQRRCQKFPGGLRTPAPPFHLASVSSTIPPHLPHLPPPPFSFHPAPSAALWLL